MGYESLPSTTNPPTRARQLVHACVARGLGVYSHQHTISNGVSGQSFATGRGDYIMGVKCTFLLATVLSFLALASCTARARVDEVVKGFFGEINRSEERRVGKEGRSRDRR